MGSEVEDVGSPPNEAVVASDATMPPIFTQWQKRWIVFMAAFAAMFSPMSSFIFYPAIQMIADSLDVTIGLVNLAITTYMIVSGIIPALLGNAADKFGRRPIYLLALSLYFVANLGLALQNTYAGLLVLRMLQSAGSSGTISLGYGIISDITNRAERGSYVGVMLLGPNVAPPVGPVLGGAVGANMGWKWIFWLLCILGGVCLVLILLALPETSHVIIGDGNLPPKGIYRTPITSVRRHRKDNRAIEEVTAALREERVSKSIWPNPVACLKLLLLKDVAVVLICNGIYYTIYCSIQASLSTLFIEIYKYQPLEAGLIYIPFGIACLFGTFIWGERYIKAKHGQVFGANLKPGKVLDYDYSRVAKSFGVSAEEVRGREAIGAFPIEKARLGSALYLVAISTVGVIGYGWAIHYHVHVAVPLILQAFVGFSGTGLFVALGTLLTDLNSTRPSTAAASANLVRCALAATALAVLQPIIDRVGVGWCFTIFGILGGICAPLMIWAIRCGRSCRQKREMPGEPTEE